MTLKPFEAICRANSNPIPPVHPVTTAHVSPVRDLYDLIWHEQLLVLSLTFLPDSMKASKNSRATDQALRARKRAPTVDKMSVCIDKSRTGTLATTARR